MNVLQAVGQSHTIWILFVFQVSPQQRETPRLPMPGLGVWADLKTYVSSSKCGAFVSSSLPCAWPNLLYRGASRHMKSAPKVTRRQDETRVYSFMWRFMSRMFVSPSVFCWRDRLMGKFWNELSVSFDLGFIESSILSDVGWNHSERKSIPVFFFFFFLAVNTATWSCQSPEARKCKSVWPGASERGL